MNGLRIAFTSGLPVIMTPFFLTAEPMVDRLQ
jgi:hypothetical protein